MFKNIIKIVAVVIFSAAITNLLNCRVYSQSSTKVKIENSEDSINYGSSSKEAKNIIRTIDQFKNALVKEDYDKLETFLHEDATSFNEHTKRLIKGKDNVLTNLKEIMKGFRANSATPLLDFRVKNPYVNVKGKEAIATYLATAKFGGSHPCELKSNVTEIFQKQGHSWKRLHYRCHWNFDKLNPTPKLKTTTVKSAKGKQSSEVIPLKLKEFKEIKGGEKLLSKILRRMQFVTMDLNRAKRSLKELKRELANDTASDVSEELAKSRKNWVALYSDETVEIFDFLNDDMNEFEKNTVNSIKEADLKDAVKKHINNWKAKIREAAEFKLALMKQSRDKNVDNDTIQETVGKLQLNIDSLSKIKSSLLNVFKRDSNTKD